MQIKCILFFISLLIQSSKQNTLNTMKQFQDSSKAINTFSIFLKKKALMSSISDEHKKQKTTIILYWTDTQKLTFSNTSSTKYLPQYSSIFYLHIKKQDIFTSPNMYLKYTSR